MREINYIVVHCTATDQDAKVESIKKYWKNRLGWKNPGYHFLVDRFGDATQLQHLDKPSNGVKGYNANAIHVSWIGGKDFDDRTEPQNKALTNIVKVLHAAYPDAEILGHKDFPGVTKSCPRFDVREWVNNM